MGRLIGLAGNVDWASCFDREWFDVSGCSVLDRAEAEAYELGHYWLGSEHLLLGVLYGWPALRDLGGVGNLSLEEVRAHIRRVDSPGRVDVERLEVTPRARLIVGFAQEEALRRGSFGLEAIIARGRARTILDPRPADEILGYDADGLPR